MTLDTAIEQSEPMKKDTLGRPDTIDSLVGNDAQVVEQKVKNRNSNIFYFHPLSLLGVVPNSSGISLALYVSQERAITRNRSIIASQGLKLKQPTYDINHELGDSLAMDLSGIDLSFGYRAYSGKTLKGNYFQTSIGLSHYTYDFTDFLNGKISSMKSLSGISVTYLAGIGWKTQRGKFFFDINLDGGYSLTFFSHKEKTITFDVNGTRRELELPTKGTVVDINVSVGFSM